MNILHSVIADDNTFHGWQKSKQQEKCRYLDERSIVLSPHLTVKSCFSGLEGNEEGKSCPRCNTSQNNALSNKSPVALSARPSDLSQSTSDMVCFPINSMSTHSMTHKENIIYSPSPSILEQKLSQPLVQQTPATCEQTSEETPVPWRCKAFAPMNREAKPAEPLHLCKWPAAQRLEWCHESLASLAHLGVQSPKNALPPCRRRPVIQRPLVGHKGVQVHNQHVEKSFCWTSASKGLLNEDGTKPPPLGDPCNQALCSSLWNAVQSEGCGKEPEQEDDGHKLHKNNVSWLSVSNFFLALSSFIASENDTAPS